MKSFTQIKKWSFILLVIIASLPLLFFSLKYLGIGLYRFQNYMSGWEATFIWGRSPFNAEKFRENPINERTKMMASLLRNKKDFLGKSKEEVIRVLGVPHWEYNNNTQWDYKIYKDKKNSWYLAFESVYSETKIVNKMYVYKWCCSITESLWISYISFMRRWKEMKKHQRAMKAKQAEDGDQQAKQK